MNIFEKIIAREIPAKVIWEDDDVIAFHDVDPQAPVHILIVPKKRIARLAEASDDDKALLGKLLLVSRDMAAKFKLANGYRVVINNGPDAGESVPHLHVHALGNARVWPLASSSVAVTHLPHDAVVLPPVPRLLNLSSAPAPTSAPLTPARDKC